MPAWSRVLVRRFGFDEREVRSLVGWPEDPADRPTRENIVKGVQHLLAKSLAGDQAVIVLAGHGAQIPASAPAPGAGHVEVDGLDEVFLPADVKSWAEGRLENAIIDDEIGQFRQKGVHVWVVFDCCHASGLARPTSSRNGDAVPDHRVVHFEDLKIPRPLPDPSQAKGPTGAATEVDPGWLDKGWARGEGSGSVVAFYACRGFEVTLELPRPKDAPKVLGHRQVGQEGGLGAPVPHGVLDRQGLARRPDRLGVPAVAVAGMGQGEQDLAGRLTPSNRRGTDHMPGGVGGEEPRGSALSRSLLRMTDTPSCTSGPPVSSLASVAQWLTAHW